MLIYDGAELGAMEIVGLTLGLTLGCMEMVGVALGETVGDTLGRELG